jgi:hypothetical protein
MMVNRPTTGNLFKWNMNSQCQIGRKESAIYHRLRRPDRFRTSLFEVLFLNQKVYFKYQEMNFRIGEKSSFARRHVVIVRSPRYWL